MNKPISQKPQKIFLLRHAESIANEKGFIASSYESQKGITLSSLGQIQAKKVAQFLKENHIKPYIFSSDFDRAYQTASIISNELKSPLEKEPLLKERYFGTFDTKKSSYYDYIWQHDKKNIPLETVEPIHEVFHRMMQVIKKVQDYPLLEVLLVSHGDPLLILEAGYQKKRLCEFKTLGDYKNAELRKLEEKTIKIFAP